MSQASSASWNSSYPAAMELAPHHKSSTTWYMPARTMHGTRTKAGLLQHPSWLLAHCSHLSLSRQPRRVLQQPSF